ncbi:unnamed protein product, partial [Prorocentrum cordatum]
RGAVEGMAAGASAACADGVDDGYGKRCELVQLEDAKSILRERGAPKFASRVGRLSKLRNATGHPDVGLARDVRSHLTGSDAGSTGDGLTEQESLAGSGAYPLKMVVVKDRAQPNVQPNVMQVRTFGAELEDAEKKKVQTVVTTGGTSGKEDAMAECARKHAVSSQAALSVEFAKAALARAEVGRDDASDEMTDAYLALGETEQREVMVNLGLSPVYAAEFLSAAEARALLRHVGRCCRGGS